MTNLPETRTVDRLDRKRIAREARTARMASHVKAAAVEAEAVDIQFPDLEDRIMRRKARVVAELARLRDDIGPASVVAFTGSIAGHFGGDLTPKSKARLDAEALFGAGE